MKYFVSKEHNNISFGDIVDGSVENNIFNGIVVKSNRLTAGSSISIESAQDLVVAATPSNMIAKMSEHILALEEMADRYTAMIQDLARYDTDEAEFAAKIQAMIDKGIPGGLIVNFVMENS